MHVYKVINTMRFELKIQSTLFLTLFCFLCILTFYQVLSQSDETISSRSVSCRSIFHRPAKCVNLQKCKPLVNLYHRNPYWGRRVISESICASNRYKLIVCCPQVDEDSDYSSSGTEESKDAQDETSNVQQDSSVSSNYQPLYPPRCGYSDSSHNRVVGGDPAELGAWPWLATLGYGKTSARISFRCGGALTSRRHVLTAAHCVYNERDLQLVRLGDHNLVSDDDGANPIDIPIEKSIVHPNFNLNTLENDIAILKLDRDISFTNAIHPICLPLSDDLRNRNFVRYYPFIAGWGTTSFQGFMSTILLETQIPVVDNKKCETAYQRVTNVVIDDRILCAGYAQGGKDACQGDSGGPLMYPQKSTYYIIGVVSGGYRCAEPGFPGIYTRVTSFLDFVLSNMN